MEKLISLMCIKGDMFPYFRIFQIKDIVMTVMLKTAFKNSVGSEITCIQSCSNFSVLCL